MKRTFRLTTKITTLLTIIVLMLNGPCYGLSPVPASQNPLIKRSILSVLKRTEVRYAESEDAKALLKANNASCLLLSSGKYLVSEEVAKDDIALLRAIVHEDIEALMQTIRHSDPARHQAIKDIVLKYFPPDNNNKLPMDLYANHKIAEALEWIILIEEGVIFSGEVPENISVYVKQMGALIDSNRHSYFTREFWDTEQRGERIKQAINGGMRFYKATQKDDIAYKEKLRKLADKFVKKNQEKNIEITKTHGEIIYGIMLRLGAEFVTGEEDPYEVLIKLFKDNEIKNVLEVGCGEGEFLEALAPILQEVRGELTGIDSDLCIPYNRMDTLENKYNVAFANISIQDLNPNLKFDLIVAVGVMSQAGSNSMENRPLGMGPGYTLEDLRTCFRNAREMAEKCISSLDDNPKAALLTNTFSTTLMMGRHIVEEYADILVWDTERKGSWSSTFNSLNSNDRYAKRFWKDFYPKSAGFAILVKKGEDDSKITTDVWEAKMLSFDLLGAKQKNSRSYTIKYDESKLTDSQIEVIKKYAELLGRKTKAKIKTVPFSSAMGSTESLITVYSVGEDFNGEGRVDVEVPEGEIRDYNLRMIGMLNIAVATSNIPDSLDEEEVKTYRPLLAYICGQYASITGKAPFDIDTLSAENFSKKVKQITLMLPQAYKMPIERINYLNKMAIKTLIAA